ncbi:hypothetical protein [Halalkalicoccus jeotgali]|uniref:Uncharacterized protein n=1 Tax=Halalkalicoccus jeotgali (strain DSM 18796 / CECT 7217 / JCM 14584 / KCTC 4019 / B3) TaxID=795797 RepID=D8J9B7_HALJB|nr:hypothetical protein [Halalkalicoccus jeotgali]ADJ16386.1 hypothetical protein HacjB3_15035 [Halalkalicoccus jeotgali B3]ELY37120.1 hypothetical protein C497_10263 [Halalkalicoccus jeotgali B3]
MIPGPGTVERVPREAVIRAWLARERESSGECGTDRSDREAFEALLESNPGAAAFLWRDAPHACYRLVLSRARFDRLHVVEGPAELRWGALSPDGTIRGCARRIDREDTRELARETGVDVPLIERLAEDPPTTEPLVLSTRRGAVPWHVADGNHRATAIALALWRGVAYEPVSAYLCVGANPVLEPFVQRLRGLAGCVRRRWDVSETQ